MYVSTFNPNQAVAFSQGYQSGATTAIPLQIRPGWSGNTVIYGFNPVASQVQAANLGQTVSSGALNPAPGLTNQAMNPLTTGGLSPWNMPVTTANAILAQQALANPFFTSGITNINAIAGTSGLAQMRVDLAETNSDVVVAAELPNVSLNDLSLTVTDDSMSISATAFAGTHACSLYRTIALPTTIKSEQVEATYANGILEIRAPKSDLVSRRKVKVTVAQ